MPPSLDARSPKEAPPTAFDTIDCLRGIGVLGVMLTHFPAFPTEQFIPGVYRAVDFFFIVSGFVLSHAYQDRLQGGMSVGQFVRRRLIRVYPLYLLALGLSVALHLFISVTTGTSRPAVTWVATIFASLLILPVPPAVAYRSHLPFPFNGPTWTLFWELVVNFVWAAIAPRLSNVRLGLLVGLGAVVLIIAAAMPDGINGGATSREFHVGAMRVFYEFFAGIAAYRVWRKGGLAWVRLPAWASLLVFVVIILTDLGDLRRPLEAVVVLIMPLLVLASTGPVPAPAIPVCRLAGNISYAAYILDYPLVLAMHFGFAAFGLSLSGLGAAGLIGYLVATLVLAWAATRWVDRPGRRWLTHKFMPRPAVAAR